MNRSHHSTLEWIQLPLWCRAQVESWIKATIPAIRDLAYWWNHHLSENGRFSVLKKAGC